MNHNKKIIWKYFQLKELVLLIFGRLFSLNKCYLLQANTQAKNQAHAGRQRWELELLREEDIEELLFQAKHLGYKDKKELIVRILFYYAGFKNCYIYRLKGKIAHLQWIIYPFENNLITTQFCRQYYTLKKQEVMIENVFTFPQYRNLGLYPLATLALLNKAREEGYRSAVAYIRIGRLEALNTFIKIGFKAKELLTEYKIFGMSWRRLRKQ